eukprot:9081080-Ditylum_brightwellii.AAC.1
MEGQLRHAREALNFQANVLRIFSSAEGAVVAAAAAAVVLPALMCYQEVTSHTSVGSGASKPSSWYKLTAYQ